MTGEAAVAAAVDRLRHAGIEAEPCGIVRSRAREQLVFRARTDAADVYVKVEADAGQFTRETLALSAATHAGVAVPSLLHADPEPPGLIVTEAVHGTPLEPGDPPERWSAAGAALRRLHDVEPPEDLPPFGSGHPWLMFVHGFLQLEEGKARKRGRLSPDEIDALVAEARARFQGEHPIPSALLHGDMAPVHVLFSPDRPSQPVLIDFGIAGAGDPLWDVAMLTHGNHPRYADVLEGYGLPEAERPRWDEMRSGYQILRCLAGAEWLVVNDMDATEQYEWLRDTAASLR